MGAEYIIMQKAPGVQLDRVLAKIEIEDRLKVVKQILCYQKKNGHRFRSSSLGVSTLPST